MNDTLRLEWALVQIESLDAKVQRRPWLALLLGRCRGLYLHASRVAAEVRRLQAEVAQQQAHIERMSRLWYLRREDVTADVIEELCDPSEVPLPFLSDGSISAGLRWAYWVHLRMVEACRRVVDAQGGPNYVEIQIRDEDSADAYRLTIQRPGRPSAHQLWLKAERELAALQTAARAVVDQLDAGQAAGAELAAMRDQVQVTSTGAADA